MFLSYLAAGRSCILIILYILSKKGNMFWQEENLLSSHNIDGETEALQTDIQRFIAILGFCLMAIFALVQSIPVIGPEKDTVIEDLSHKLDLQKIELEHLKSENVRLRKEIGRLMEYAGISRSLKNELDQARRRLDRQREEVDKLAGEKVVQQKDLMQYNKLLLKRDEKIRKLKAAQEAMEQFMEKITATVKGPVPKEKKPEVDRKPVEEKGIYVAFESDLVFLNLLGAGKIRLFIKVMGMEQGFRVLSRDGKIDFKFGDPYYGLDLWELKESMVPPQILRDFTAWTTLSSREKMLIVGLTHEISQEIRGRKVVTGRFIIREEGRVTYYGE